MGNIGSKSKFTARQEMYHPNDDTRIDKDQSVASSNQAIINLEKNSRLDESEKQEIKKIRERVTKTIDKLFILDPTYRQYNFGSSHDSTQISPGTDLDKTIVLDSNQYGYLADLKDGRGPSIALNLVANMLKKEYGDRLEYCRPNVNVVTIKFKDSKFPVDIEVGLRNDNSPDFGNILIPDTNLKKFKPTNTILNDRLLTKKNIESGNRLKTNIRTEKAVNELLGLKLDSNYTKTLLATKSKYQKGALNQLKHTYDILAKSELKPINNPYVMNDKIESGCSDREQTLKKINDFREVLSKAQRFEKQGNKKESLRILQEHLGPEFWKLEGN